MKDIFKKFIPFAVVLTLTFGTIYAVSQQMIRLSANNTPSEMATDIAMKLEAGSAPSSLVGQDKIDIKKSLSPFVVIIDADKKVIDSNVILDGKAPTIPDGVLNSAKKSGENRITWQPKNDAREAIVAKTVESSAAAYVVVGHSLGQAEALIDRIGYLILILWIISLIATFFAVVFIQKILK